VDASVQAGAAARPSWGCVDGITALCLERFPQSYTKETELTWSVQINCQQWCHLFVEHLCRGEILYPFSVIGHDSLPSFFEGYEPFMIDTAIQVLIYAHH
jgi:hypothetical protein